MADQCEELRPSILSASDLNGIEWGESPGKFAP